jgi:hypothetical protein
MDERRARFTKLMNELDEARAAYSQHIPIAQSLVDGPPPVRHVDWEGWERDKKRFDAADAALLSFLRGEVN